MSSAQPAAGSGPDPAGSSDRLQDAMIAFNDEVFETLQKLLKAQQELVRAVIGAASMPGSAEADEGGQDAAGAQDAGTGETGDGEPEVIFPLDTAAESPEGAEVDSGRRADAENEADEGASAEVPPDADWLLDAEAAEGAEA